MTEHLDVLVVGAGLSGICAAHHLRSECPWASFAILEAREAIGGTWDLFRYPGIRSDSDMFTLGYPFRPWQEDRAIVDGPSIRRYIEETAEEDGVVDRIRFGTRVVAAAWSSDEACWRVTAEHVGSGERYELTCGFLFACTGYYRYDQGYLPEFAGMARFAGRTVHPQHWPADLDCTGLRVVVIGSGATAVTLVPALAETAAQVTMLQRSPTYITSLPSRSVVAAKLRRVLPERQAATAVRWLNAMLALGFYQFARRRPAAARRMLRRGVERQLPAGYDVDTDFSPRYDPWDQRLCIVPDGDLFRAIRHGRASVVTDEIETFTETGLLLRSGRELEADVIVTATGLDLLFLGGIELTVDGEAVDPAQHLTYKGMMLEGVPNLALAMGYTNASWTLKADLTCAYVARLVQHLRVTGATRCVPAPPDGDQRREPLLSLSSGYVQRSANRFPKQGSRAPWRVHQNWLLDRRAMRAASVDDGTLQFSDPRRAPASAAAAHP